ncbi:LPD38 domain-containing protein [Hoylesella nanceiensis]|uniref:MuF-C-terminal domain-containing protein n=1 Tax=Hoylesella nanceiensis TaxID=425941 RepID=UPI001CB48FC1|nr:LPD38 domain-containing protein [Hoylesella nanceiensis]MBF1421631.1 hypothetical protein [Hoylesella nanceiensis]
MPNKITYTIKTADGKEHQVSKENIDKHGIQAYADAYEGATIRMRDSKKGDYDIPLANYNDAKAQGLHAFAFDHLPPKAQPQAKQQVAQKQPTQQVATTAPGTPMTAAQKAQVLDNTNNLIAQSQSDLSRTMRKIDYAKQNTGLDVKPIKLGENRKIIKQSSFNPQTGKKEESYLTESGNIHNSYVNAVTEQNAIDDFKEQEKQSKLENQLNAAYKERDSITKALQRRMAELDKQGGHGLLRQFADAMSPDLAMHSSPRDYEMDEEYGALMSAARKNNSTIQILEDKKKGRMNNFWSTLGATFSNGYTFTDGLSGVRDNIAILNANKRADKINRKRQRGEMLTNEEDAFDKALLANLVNEEIEGTYGQEYGALARAAKITAGTADVVKDFLLSGGTGIAVTKGAAKGVMNAGAKYLTKKAGESLLKASAKAFGRGLLKATGIGVGSLAGGALITNTTGIGKTAEEMSKQVTGRVGVDQHGNYIFTDSKDLMHAFIEAERSMIGENASEMLGEFIPGSKVLKKGLEKIGLSKISSYLTSIGNKSWAKNYGKLLEAAGWNGLPGEGLEEYAGIAYNSLTGDSEGGIATLGDARTHIDIWLGCAAAGALLGAPNVVALGANTAQYYRYKHATNKAAQQAKSQLPADRWNALQERIDNTENQDLTNLMLEVYTNKELSPKQKKAVFNYTDNLVRMRGYNIGSINNADATRDEKGEKELHKEENIGNAYATGYHATEDELANIKNELELRHRQLTETFKDDPSALQQIEEDPKAFLQGLKESEVGGEKAKVINAYEETRAAYDGMIQRVKDNIDDAITENNNVIEQRTHQDGNIYPATMKLDDRKVYVVGGNVQMNEDGKGIDHEKSSSSVMIRDAETGKIEMVDPSAILSVDTPVNAEEEKATSSEQIKQTYAQEQANKIDGVLEFKAGDTYSILGEDKKQHTIQIVGEAIDEKTKQPNPDMVMASIDGLEPTMLPKEQIQAMNDEENLWRLDQSLKQDEDVENTTPHSKQSYGYQKKITLTNENGNLVRGEIVSGQNEDGRFEVQTEEPVNGKTVNHLTAEELDAMHAQIQEEQGEQMESPALVAENATTQKEDVSGMNDGTIAENATVQKEETPQHEPTALERIPTNEQGEPIYEQADPETAWDAIVEQTEGDESIAKSVADGMVADMEAAVRRAEKAKVKGGTTIAEKIAAEKERVANIEQAKATLEHWKKIASTNSRRQEAIQAEESRKAKEAALLRKEQEEKERDKREEAQPQTLDYKLSDEVDENGHPFVLTSAGELAFGNIGKETGLAPAPILLSEGVITNSKTNAGYGLVHIEARHGEQIRNAGYPSVVAFVEEVAKHYDVIREGINRSGEQTYMLQLTDRHNNTLMVELSGDGTYYNINTAGIFKTSYGKNRREVYNRHATDNQSTESGEESQGEAQSGTTSPSRMKSSTRSSAGKVSESSNAMQENAEKTSENETTRVETNPTEAQKEAGNYKKGHIKVDGMNITIEQPKGSIRRGKDASGKEWESEMHNTYGYIRGTEGVDGDHIDIFLSDNPNEGNVFVVDQVNKDGSFDEHKVMYGFADKESARQAYLSNYEDGWQGLGNITEVSKEEFKKWIGSSKRKTKPFAEYKGIQSIDHSQKEQLKSTQGKEGNEQDFEDKKELEDFVASTDSNNRTKIDESKYDAEDLFAPLLLDGKPSNLAVMTLVSDNINDPVLQIAVYDYSSDIDNKTNSGWQKWGDLADEYNAHVAEEDRTWERNDNAMLGFKTVDAAVKFNDWLKSKEEGKSNVVHSFGNSASQNDTIIKLSDTSFAKMENGEQKAEREIGWLVDHNIRLEENSRKLDEIAHLLFDGDNIDSNRESTLREEAKKILEENEKLSRDYQKNYSDKYFGTDDITANYILQEANERLIALGIKPVKESYYFQNRKNEVAQNAVVHLLKRIGIPVHFITRVGAEVSGQGNSRGWTNGLDIWLTKDNINAETPVHEYTHIWTFALMKKNPKLWAEIKNLLKDSEWVDTIQSMDEYKYTLDNEDLLYSEVLSRISGERNGEKFESMAFKLIEEVNSVEKKVDLKRGLEKLRDALKRFWEWVGVNLFGMKEFKSVDDVCDRVLFDLLNESDIARTEEMREYYEEEREMNAIIDKAKEDGTYLKTPNGEDSKLPEKVWAYARTKKFKTQLSDRLNLILNESKEDFKDWEKEEFRDLFKKHGLLEENNEPGRFLVSQFMYSEKYYDRKGKMQEEAKETMNSGKGGENVSSVKSVDMRDAEYIKAVENNDTETIQRLLSEEAERKGYSNDSSYQGSLAFNGSAPYQNAYFETKEERKEAWENDEYEDTMSLGDYVDSGIDTNDLEWNLTDPMALRQADPKRREAIENLRQTVRSNSKTITIYRAVDANIKENEIRNGDWVTPSRSYAEYHIGLQDWENGRIIEQEVSIDDLWWDGNDIAEWGYDNGKGEVYKNTPNNRKMFEVTYDDKGNIIPLSERFNEDNDDIRYRYEEGEYPFVDLRKDHTSSKDIIKRGRKTGNIYFSRYSPARVRTALIKRLGEMGIKYDVNNAVTTNSSYVNFVANGVKFDVRLATHTKISDTYDNTKALDFKFEDGKINDVALDSSAYGFKTEEILNIIDEVKRFNELGYKPNDDITKVPSNDKQIDWYDYPYIGETLFEKVNESVLRQREGEYRELQLQEERKTKERMKTFMETFYPFTTSDGAQVVIGKLDGKRLVYKDGVRLKRSTNGYELDEALKEADNTINETRRQFELEEKKQLPFEEWQMQTYGNVVSNVFKVDNESNSSKDNEAKTFAKQHNLDASDVIAYKQAMEEGLLRDANNALSAIRRKLREENKGLSLSGFTKIFSPIREALYKQFGDLGVLEKEYHDSILKERGLMEAARKREEEERKRQNEPIEELMSMTSEERDAEYMRALETKDEKRMSEVLQAEAKLKGYSMGAEYQGEGAWKAPSNPGYSSTEERRAALEKDAPHLNIDDIANGYMNQPEDIFTDLRAYGNDNESGKESAKAISDAISVIKDGKGMPEVTVYRAVPTSVEEESLRNGDWVTPSKAYAKEHGEHRLDGDYRIIEQKVPANELWWDGNDIREWGFDNGKDYAYKNTENSRKLNDLITRDDQGNVILPSQRFNDQVEDERFRNDEELEKVNQRFNEELENLTEENADKVTLWLGKPSDVLLSSGIENKPLKLYGNKVIKKMKKHGFALDELRDLPKAVADPIAVFDNLGRLGNRSILTELTTEQGNFLVTIDMGKGEKDVDFNIVSSVFGKGKSKIVSWIERGLTAYINKKKALNYLHHSAPIAEALSNSRLSSAANIVKSFENPTNSSEKVLDRKTTQAKEGAEKERQQMVERANELAETLHLDNVEIVTDASTLEGKKAKAKGFYSTSTGKITIVIPNHSNIADVEKTLLHEAVAHHGLRKLFGEHFDNFLDNVFKNASEDVRREIVKLAAKNKWDFRIATEEYLASLAEDTNFENMPNGLWDKVKRLFLDMLRSIGLLKQKDGELNDNELRYILWRSYKNLKEKGQSNNILNKAEDIAMQHRLKVGNYAPQEEGKAKVSEKPHKTEKVDNNTTLYREDEPEVTARTIYEDAVKDTGKMSMLSALAHTYSKEGRERFKHKFSESYFDYSRSIKQLQDAISKASGRKLEEFEEVWKSLNAKSSIDSEEINLAMLRYISPLSIHIAEMIRGVKMDGQQLTLDDVEVYMNALHGIERNAYMANSELKSLVNKKLEKWKENRLKKLRDSGMSKEEALSIIATEEADKRDEITQLNMGKTRKDYSGLTALFSDENTNNIDVAILEERAQKYVDAFEEAVGKDKVDEMWKKVKNLNDFSIRKAYLSGLINKKHYDEIKNMYEHYVPLRGWHDDYAGDIFEYVNAGQSMDTLQGVVKKAYGRTTRAGNILGTMASMANTAIVQGNKNLVAQKFLNLALNYGNKSGLLMVSKQWYEETASGELVPLYPSLKEGMSAAEMQQRIEEFEAEMEEAKKSGTKKIYTRSFGDNMPQNFQKWQEKQHSIRALRNGVEHTIYVLGNPKAAQAFNGLLTPESQVNAVQDIIMKVMRFQAMMQTSLSPEFVISNFQRDVLTAATGTYIKYGWGAGKDFASNLTKVMPVSGLQEGNPFGIYNLIHKYNKGTLDKTNDIERMFDEFVRKGGMTGISSITRAEEFEKQMEKSVKRIKRGKLDVPQQLWEDLADGIEFMNKGIENATRFAAYMTSRKMGKNVTDSIFDAKECSVNFNMKGSGAWGNLWMRRYILYANPALQSLRMLGTWYEASPKRFMGVFSTVLTASILTAMLGYASGGDDGDDNDWYKLNEFNRYNYISVKAGNGFAHWSLPQEMRPVWALGQIVFDWSNGRVSAPIAINSMATQLNNLSPMAFFSGGSDNDDSFWKTAVKAWTPTVAADFMDAYAWNENFLGKNITYRNDWNKEAPEWRKAGKDTPKWAVNLSRVWNKATGGADNRKSWWDSPALNPSAVYYIMSSQFGGMGTLATKLSRAFEQWQDPEQEVEARNIPFVSKFWVTVGDDYSKNRVLNEEFKSIWNEWKLTDYEIKHNESDLEKGLITDEEYANLEADKKYLANKIRYEALEDLMKDYNTLMRKRNDENDNPLLDEEILELKKEVVERAKMLDK